MTVVSLINHLGGLRSRPLNRLPGDTLFWAHWNVCSVRATHVQGTEHSDTGHAISQRSTAGGMEAPTQDGREHLEHFRSGGHLTVRIRGECQLPVALLEAERCSSPDLAVCMPLPPVGRTNAQCCRSPLTGRTSHGHGLWGYLYWTFARRLASRLEVVMEYDSHSVC